MACTVVFEIWLFFYILVAVVYPVADGRKDLLRAFALFYQSLTGKKDARFASPQNGSSMSTTEVTEASTEILSVHTRLGVLVKSE
jgi:hypothetical protein